MEQEKGTPSRGQFNTLVQSGTANSNDFIHGTEKVVHGNGSDLADKKAWKGRAQRKVVSQALVVQLVAIAEKNNDPECAAQFWNTYHCQNKLVSHGGRTYGEYCKNRFCTLCNSIRKAEIINKYLPVISTWEDPQFVTLTEKAVPAEKLERWFFGVDKAFRRIRERCKKRHQRGKGLKIMGIKSLECNFNPKKKTYNPHFHLLVPNKEIAKLLKAEWLKTWTDDFAKPSAQHMRRVKNMEKDLIETIKYGSKIFTDFDANNKGKLPPEIYVVALYNIFKAMKPYRLFERFGFNLPATTKKEVTKKAVPVTQCEDFVFAIEVFDWINTKTGEGLTGYAPTAQLEWLLTENMNVDLF